MTPPSVRPLEGPRATREVRDLGGCPPHPSGRHRPDGPDSNRLRRAVVHAGSAHPRCGQGLPVCHREGEGEGVWHVSSVRALPVTMAPQPRTDNRRAQRVKIKRFSWLGTSTHSAATRWHRHLPSCRVHGGGVWLGVTPMHPPRGPRSPLEALGGTVHGLTVFGQDSIRSVHGRYDTGGGAPHSGGQLRAVCFEADLP